MLPISCDKPGCYGSPLCCAPASIACSGCNFVEDCKAAAVERAAALRARFNITPNMLTPTGRKDLKKQRLADVKIAAEQAKPKVFVKPVPIDLLGDIARKQLDRLSDAGVDLMDLGGDFVLPVRGVPEFLRLALQTLEAGAVETPVLAQRYQSQLIWPEKTARSHAEIAARMLMQCGRAERDPRQLDRILLRSY